MAFVAAGGAAEGAGAAAGAGDQLGLARAIGRGGKPAPSWVKNNPGYFQAYRAGLDELRQRGGSQDMQPLGPWSRRGGSRPPSRRASRAGRRLARTRSANPRRGYLRRAFSPRAAAQRLADNPVMRSGDGGGLLLAFVLYPMFLATVKYGAAGPGMWFRAKWLNQGKDDGRIANPGGAGGYWVFDARTGKWQEVDPNTLKPIAGVPEVAKLPAGAAVIS